MKTQYKYTGGTKVKVAIESIAKKNPCVPALMYLKRYENYTILELTQDLKECSPSWCIWWLKTFGEQIEPGVRIRFIDIIRDPKLAFILYRSMGWLTEKEEYLLMDRFKGKLPVAERELREGTVRRVKNGCN